MGILKIGTPYLEKNGDRTKLVADLTENNSNSFKLWYEVSNEYAEYFSTETIDAFVVAMLPYAMKKGLDIVSDFAMSEKLNLQLNKFLIPVLTKYSKTFNKINISVKNTTNKNYNLKRAFSTGFSRGVDSFDTIQDTEKELTHITFLNVGSHLSTNPRKNEGSSNLYEERLATAKKSAELFDFPLIDINSNLGELLTVKYVQIHHYCSFSAILALQKLFSVYYYASGYAIDSFSIKKCDSTSASYEPFIAEMLSTESTDFYITGLDKTRLDKVKAITNYKLSYDNLNVCYFKDINCGKCEKCYRTQLELMSLGKLELYKNSFDLKFFEKVKDKAIDYMLKHQNLSYFKEIIDEMKKNNIPLGLKNTIKKQIYGIAIKILKK